MHIIMTPASNICSYYIHYKNFQNNVCVLRKYISTIQSRKLIIPSVCSTLYKNYFYPDFEGNN